MRISGEIYDRFFRRTHAGKLIYNTCWEDPKADRALLNIQAGARIAMITSAGCNALDYLLDDPAEVHAVDMNFRQNALLELKIAGIVSLQYDDFFQIFGRGSHARFKDLYFDSMRPILSASARQFWDRHTQYFSPNSARRSFYYYGTAGDAAWVFRRIMQWLYPQQLSQLKALFAESEPTMQAQRYAAIEGVIFSPWVRCLIRQPMFLSLLGVPRAQRDLIDASVRGGVSAFIQSKLRRVFSTSTLRENYFWHVYLHGSYSESCCPNYLKREHFQILKSRVSRIKLYTCTVEEFLRALPENRQLTHAVLLDHQDWMAHHAPELLDSEWRMLLARSAPGAKFLLRSAAPNVSFLPDFVASACLEEGALTRVWHQQDRVGTYGCTWLGEKRRQSADVFASQPQTARNLLAWDFSGAYARISNDAELPRL
jgi:S-adenosylmethionine-diacylglycerol 3-amino-3-carboxypropyl transferase